MLIVLEHFKNRENNETFKNNVNDIILRKARFYIKKFQ